MENKEYERVKLVKVSIDIETTLRHPDPIGFEWQGRIGDDFFDQLHKYIEDKVYELFS